MLALTPCRGSTRRAFVEDVLEIRDLNAPVGPEAGGFWLASLSRPMSPPRAMGQDKLEKNLDQVHLLPLPHVLPAGATREKPRGVKQDELSLILLDRSAHAILNDGLLSEFRISSFVYPQLRQILFVCAPSLGGG